MKAEFLTSLNPECQDVQQPLPAVSPQQCECVFRVEESDEEDEEHGELLASVLDDADA